MPEGPEVRKHADKISAVLQKQKLTHVWSRMREAKAWLQENSDLLLGRRVLRVRSHGKHLLIELEGEYFFHCHLMMWGRWQVFDSAPDEIDRRERARLASKKGCAILFSAPIFQVGQGDPYEKIENLASLGPDILPYDGDFDTHDFLRRLEREEHADRSIGAALLDQQICAGIGNYLRADILFECKINPWKRVADLSLDELNCLETTIPEIARRAYLTGGTTTEDERERMRNDATLVYREGSEWGTHHTAFRRTNLPCLRCGEKIRQLRQMTRIIESEDGASEDSIEKTRIMYFCPNCQNVPLESKRTKSK